MGREVRFVPKNWRHPTDSEGHYTPLHDGYDDAVERWDLRREEWDRGEFPECASAENRLLSYEQWDGPRPEASEYMPDWPESERTHYQMYETVSEGTPISPIFATPEDLARWLADTGANAFAGMKASYEGWLRVARGESAPSAVVRDGVIVSGVEGLKSC